MGKREIRFKPIACVNSARNYKGNKIKSDWTEKWRKEKKQNDYKCKRQRVLSNNHLFIIIIIFFFVSLAHQNFDICRSKRNWCKCIY